MELVAVHDLVADKDKIIDLCINILNWEWPRSDTIRKRSLLSSSASLPTNLVLLQRFSQPPDLAVLGHARIRCVAVYKCLESWTTSLITMLACRAFVNFVSISPCWKTARYQRTRRPSS
jgi:hypothetical protein